MAPLGGGAGSVLGDNDQVPRTPRDRWTIVVPLKSSARGKSRIELDPALRRRLAVAMALDTVTAAAAADGVLTVLVVVDDPADGDQLAAIPWVRIVRSRTPGLNQAIADGLHAVGHDASSVENVADGPGPVAVLPADLPSLAAMELSEALAAAVPHRSAVVADRQGTGTTLLTAAGAHHLQPRYGSESLRRHVAGGAVLLDLPVTSGLRRDVDQIDDLAGVRGPRTLAVLTEAGWAPDLCAAQRAV